MAKRFLPFLLIGTGLLLLSISTITWLLNPAQSQNSAAPLPEQIAGLPLVRSLSGKAAIEEIHRMHGKDFALVSGAVGIYGAQSQVTLWVSGTAKDAHARQMVADMRARIAEGNSPFTEIGERRQGERSIYELAGLGQRHFYFQSRHLVIWLGCDAELVETVLAQALIFYP